MKPNRRFLIGFTAVTLLFFLIILINSPEGIVIRFNATSTGQAEYSVTLIGGVIFLLSLFLGFQLYDEKNENDYVRWYVLSLVLIGFEIYLLILNL